MLTPLQQILEAVLLAAGEPLSRARLEEIMGEEVDAATLDEVLLNVGPAKAQAIVEYRRENGAFKSIEQLAMVKGIGLKTVEKNRDRITVGSGRAMVPVARASKSQPAIPTLKRAKATQR